jgi:hypothetical protein
MEKLTDVKIKIVYRDSNEEIAVETLWASPINEYFQIKNIPFFAPNIAYNDIVDVEMEGDEYYFEELISPSRHSTIQIIVLKTQEINRILREIELMGCAWEGIHGQKLITVDVPPAVPFETVTSFLSSEFENGVLDYKEACLGFK